MNRLYKKKWFMGIGACAALIITGIGIAVLSLKLEFAKAWVQSGLLMSLAGCVGLGVVIALSVHSIPHQERFHRKRLEVKAWKDLGTSAYGLVIAAFSFYYLREPLKIG